MCCGTVQHIAESRVTFLLKLQEKLEIGMNALMFG